VNKNLAQNLMASQSMIALLSCFQMEFERTLKLVQSNPQINQIKQIDSENN